VSSPEHEDNRVSPASASRPGGTARPPTSDAPRRGTRAPRPRNPFGAEPESPERPPRFGRPSGCSWWVTLPVLILANYLVVSLLFPATGGPVEVPYTLFREQVVAGNVATIATRGDTIQGVFSA